MVLLLREQREQADRTEQNGRSDRGTDAEGQGEGVIGGRDGGEDEGAEAGGVWDLAILGS